MQLMILTDICIIFLFGFNNKCMRTPFIRDLFIIQNSVLFS